MKKQLVIAIAMWFGVAFAAGAQSTPAQISNHTCGSVHDTPQQLLRVLALQPGKLRTEVFPHRIAPTLAAQWSIPNSATQMGDSSGQG